VRIAFVLAAADGADADVAQGTISRFMDEGLVYADGSRLHLVPFSRLPLRGFGGLSLIPVAKSAMRREIRRAAAAARDYGST
jgi:hypothetical protein